MYTLYLSLALASVVGLGWTLLGLWEGWWMGTFLGFLAFVATWIVVGRRFNKRIQPTIMTAQKLAEDKQFLLAINSIESLLPIANWIPTLKGQLYAQLGVLSLGANKEDQAIDYLSKASNRAAEAKIHLAALFVRKKRVEEAKPVLDAALKYNRKHVLLHNFYAYILKKVGDTEGAIQALNLVLAKVPENDTTKDNLSRLKNGKKMTMKPFGMHWYSLGLERMPASMAPAHMQQQQPRKGFRTPPKRQKR